MYDQSDRNILSVLKNIPNVSRADYIKAVTIADKAVSNMYSVDRLVRKNEMSAEMLRDREIVLRETARVMAAFWNDEDFSVSKWIYTKYTEPLNQTAPREILPTAPQVIYAYQGEGAGIELVQSSLEDYAPLAL
jgi:hypothetical protein